MPPRKPLAERHAALTDRRSSDECWPWLGAKNAAGYGSIRPGAPARTSVMAHRVAYELATGETIPGGMTIDHRCGNTSCVNPGHLEVVTQAENQRRSRNTKLSAEAVRDIRRHVAGGEEQQVVAGWFGIHPSTVSRIVARIDWADVA